VQIKTKRTFRKTRTGSFLKLRLKKKKVQFEYSNFFQNQELVKQYSQFINDKELIRKRAIAKYQSELKTRMQKMLEYDILVKELEEILKL